jgi:hypothetical protein
MPRNVPRSVQSAPPSAPVDAHERVARDRRQAQHAAEALQQALDALGLPEDLVTEIAGRLRSQQKLLGKIVGVMCPPLLEYVRDTCKNTS